MNKNTTNILLIVFVLAVAAGLAFFALNSANSPSFLFLQQAQSGTFELANNGNPDEYMLTLENVWPETTYFSDRPQRISGTMSNEEFLGLDGMFSIDNPPNAAVVLSDASSEEDVILVELMNPQYDPAAGRLIYTVKLFNDEVSAGLKNWRARKDQSLPNSFSHVTLFIDSNSYTLGIELTNQDVCHISDSC